MKKNFGFTLAEALLTLSIIGVVAGLVAPQLIMNTGKAKVGPILYKAKNNFENAVSLMLEDRGVDSISKVENPVSMLGDYAKIITYENESDASYQLYDREGNTTLNEAYTRFDSEDHITYWINIDTSIVPDSNFENIPTNQECGELFVDINGSKGPNRESKDVFRFVLYNDGTLRPFGVEGYKRSADSDGEETYYWWENNNCDENGLNMPSTCTGSIFDNDLKIIYE